MKKHKITLVTLGVCWALISKQTLAACTTPNDFTTAKITASADISLDVPRDTPYGTTVFETVMGSAPSSKTITCSGQNNIGIIHNSAFSTHNTKGPLFELTGTGLSWYIRGSNGTKIDAFRDSISGIFSSTWTADTYTLGIVKTGEISEGAKVINGELARLSKAGVNIISFNTSMTINQKVVACKSPDVQVNMGENVQVSSIESASPPQIPFNINLLDCPSAINKIHFTIKANTAIIDAASGIVELTAGSTAEGVGLQLFTEQGTPLPIDKEQIFSDSTGNIGGNFQIPLKAAYYHKPGQPVRPGTADSSVTFIMTYL